MEEVEKKIWSSNGFRVSFLVGGVVLMLTYFMHSLVQVNAIPSEVQTIWLCVLGISQIAQVIVGLFLMDSSTISNRTLREIFSVNTTHSVIVSIQAIGALAVLGLHYPLFSRVVLSASVVFQAGYRVIMALEYDTDITQPTLRITHNVLTFTQLSFWYLSLMNNVDFPVQLPSIGEAVLPLLVLFHANSCVEMAWLASGRKLATECAPNKPLGMWISLFLAIVSYLILPLLSMISEYPEETSYNTAVASSGLAVLFVGIMIGMKWSKMEEHQQLSVWAVLAFCSWGLITMALSALSVTQGHSLLVGNFSIKMAEHALLVMIGYVLHYYHSKHSTKNNASSHPYEALVEIL